MKLLLAGFLSTAMDGLLSAAAGSGYKRPALAPKSPLKDHVILGRAMQGYLTGQKRPSQRPVYRAQYVGRSKYQPHQGAQECARRVSQGLA